MVASVDVVHGGASGVGGEVVEAVGVDFASGDAADEDACVARRDRAILELFYAAGLRLSELAGLDAAARARIVGGNARAIYGLPDA